MTPRDQTSVGLSLSYRTGQNRLHHESQRTWARKNLGRERSALFRRQWQSNLLHHDGEPRVGPNTVESRLAVQIDQPSMPLLIGAIQPFQCAVWVVQTRI